MQHLRFAHEVFLGMHTSSRDSLSPWGGCGSSECDVAGDSNKANNRSTLDSLAELLRQRERATIGGLELGELLGRGSFGRVYKGGMLPCLNWSISCLCSPITPVYR